MPDSTLSTAIKEAYASAPTDEVIHHTLEIWHEDFSVPIRVVRDHANLTATLEATAPRNASTAVEFVAYAFDIIPPDVTHDAVPQCTIEIDNVSRTILAQIEAAMTSVAPITVIYRAFLSSDLTGPENDPPLTMTIKTITANVFRIRATAGFDDLGNRRFPGMEYTADTFPGLIAR
jgi:hypothetical protein